MLDATRHDTRPWVELEAQIDLLMSDVRASPADGAFLYFHPFIPSFVPSFIPIQSTPHLRIRVDDHFVVVTCLVRADTPASSLLFLTNSTSHALNSACRIPHVP